MSLADQVLNVLPTNEAASVTAKDIFDLCKDAEDSHDVSTALSQLFIKGEIRRKVVNLGHTRFAYWKDSESAKDKIATHEPVAEVPTFTCKQLPVSDIELTEPVQKPVEIISIEAKPRPHKYAELIKACADGAEIERNYNNQGWELYVPEKHTSPFELNPLLEWRIKPKLKFAEAHIKFDAPLSDYGQWAARMLSEYEPNVRFTFDDGKLVGAEVLK